MTTTIKATDTRGITRELEAIFPADLDPRFDFARPAKKLREIQRKRLAHAEALLGGPQRNIKIIVHDEAEYDLDLAPDTKPSADDLDALRAGR